MGTASEEIKKLKEAETEAIKANNQVVHDFDHNFTPNTDEWHSLNEFSNSLEINFINQPRSGITEFPPPFKKNC